MLKYPMLHQVLLYLLFTLFLRWSITRQNFLSNAYYRNLEIKTQKSEIRTYIWILCVCWSKCFIVIWIVKNENLMKKSKLYKQWTLTSTFAKLVVLRKCQKLIFLDVSQIKYIHGYLSQPQPPTFSFVSCWPLLFILGVGAGGGVGRKPPQAELDTLETPLFLPFGKLNNTCVFLI